MGQVFGVTYRTFISAPDTSPNVFDEATFKHTYGFTGERKQRKAVLTEEEMEAAGIEPFFRDYCAHHLREFRKCRREHFPWVIACKPELHVWEQCEHDDYILRMKEYERERRLLERAKKKKEIDAVKSREVLAE